ncbi:flagellar assembly protein FliT [Lysinibacillus contaminans]|uniref:Flagellar protein FliT n=1 Tax=Lysinibacillus contaminans TaxID=1293441 RepID=A0ABR5JXK1_9BACI|nr:flagellar protein FliT [Lysinibacillus contaminans]KOS66685.1 flagellar assembly protein FliT [Lysinibacillus contaminans]
MNTVQAVLQVSAKLYQHLTVLPSEDERDNFIEKIHLYLDERGQLIDQLQHEGFQVDLMSKAHATLAELDKGIQGRLDKVMKSIQADMKDLQNAKKNEQQYMNPYASVQVMDGRYYDKKN